MSFLSFLFAESPTVPPPPFDASDDLETSILIAKLSLEDISEVTSSRKGKRRADASPSDEEIAYQIQKEELTNWLTVAEDVKFVQSIDKAVVTDHAFLDAFSIAEAAESEDRRAAELLSRGQPLPPPSAAQKRLEDPAFSLEPEPKKPSTAPQKKPASFASWAKVPSNFQGVASGGASTVQENAFALSEIDPEEQYLIQKSFFSWLGSWVDPLAPGVAGPSGERNKPNSISNRIECTICSDPLQAKDAFHTSCDHDYCPECVRELVEHFTRDESLFPLRCCQAPIPIDSIYPFLTPALRKLLDQKTAEYSVPAKDRLYCVNPICSAFLGSSEGKSSRRGVLCPSCYTTTCPRCKGAGHTGDDCTVNEGTAQVRLLASEQGWRTCPGCRTVVELDVGCYHITCICRTQFCYLCAALWKTCTCPQWEENRLFETARRRVVNELGTAAVRNTAPAALEARVQARAQTLQSNNICESHSWMYRSGGGECEECHFNSQDFVFICGRCAFLACKPCTMNRL